MGYNAHRFPGHSSKVKVTMSNDAKNTSSSYLPNRKAYELLANKLLTVSEL